MSSTVHVQDIQGEAKVWEWSKKSKRPVVQRQNLVTDLVNGSSEKHASGCEPVQPVYCSIHLSYGLLDNQV